MKSLIFFLILLSGASVFAQYQNQKPTPPAASAAPVVATPAKPSSATGDAAASAVSAVALSEVSADASITAEDETPMIADLRMKPGVLTNFGITYFGRKLEEAGVSDEFNTIVGELRAGYNFNFGLFAGATAHYDTGKAAGQTVATYYGGPTIGYSSSMTGIFVAATYHLIGKQDLDALGEYDKVSGLQIDVAYPMMLTESLKFGPQLSYRSMKSSDSDTLAENKTKELVPFMGLWFIF